jgi:hypothetical protein
VAVVEGPAGIGKTRLLAEAREKARAVGFTVLAARGSDLERELPFDVVRQLFEPVLVDPAGRTRWLSGSAAAAARVFEPPEDECGAGDLSFGILYGLYWLTANLAAERPLLLAIDDSGSPRPPARSCAQILRSEPPLAFVHPLVRDAVYHELSPAERELRHEHDPRRLHPARRTDGRRRTRVARTRDELRGRPPVMPFATEFLDLADAPADLPRRLAC